MYHAAVQLAHQQLSVLGRVQVVPRTFIPNFMFGPDNIGVAVDQDGLVANTLKHMHGHCRGQWSSNDATLRLGLSPCAAFDARSAKAAAWRLPRCPKTEPASRAFGP